MRVAATNPRLESNRASLEAATATSPARPVAIAIAAATVARTSDSGTNRGANRSPGPRTIGSATPRRVSRSRNRCVPGQAGEVRALRAPEAASGLLGAQALQVTEHDGLPIGLGEGGRSLRGARGSLPRSRRRVPALADSPARPPSARGRAASRRPSGPVARCRATPKSQLPSEPRLRTACGPADEDEERGLEGVARVVGVAGTPRQTRRTIGPCRSTRAEKAASAASCRLRKSSSNRASSRPPRAPTRNRLSIESRMFNALALVRSKTFDLADLRISMCGPPGSMGTRVWPSLPTRLEILPEYQVPATGLGPEPLLRFLLECGHVRGLWREASAASEFYNESEDGTFERIS